MHLEQRTANTESDGARNTYPNSQDFKCRLNYIYLHCAGYLEATDWVYLFRISSHSFLFFPVTVALAKLAFAPVIIVLY